MPESAHWVATSQPTDRYSLTATIGLTSVVLRFDAENDLDATIHGIKEILDRGAMEDGFDDDRKFWSKGRIVLRNPAGTILRTMPAKAGTDHG